MVRFFGAVAMAALVAGALSTRAINLQVDFNAVGDLGKNGLGGLMGTGSKEINSPTRVGDTIISPTLPSPAQPGG